MSTKVIKEGNVTTTIMDLTNGVGGRSAEVRRDQEPWSLGQFVSHTSVLTV